MATVTTLGTAQAKAATSLSFTYANGLVVSAGDWIIVALALDVLDSNTIVKFIDSSTGYEFVLLKQVSGVNTGNACAAIFMARALVDSASSDSISMTWNTSQASAATFYKATGLTKNAAPTETGTASVWANLHATANPNHVGAYFPNMKAGTITSIDLQIYRVGSPPGNFRINMIDPADHSAATFYEGACSALPTSGGWVTFTGSYTLSGDRGFGFTVQYTGGDSSNKLVIGRVSPPNLEQCSLTIPFGGGAWTLDPVNYMTCNKNIVGANVYNPYGTSAVATGTGTTAASGSTGTLPDNPVLVLGVAGVEDAGNDISGVWASGAGYIYGNAQSVGTTGAGDASNITTYSAAMLTTSTAALNASLGSLDSIDWVAMALSLHEAAASGNTYNMAAVAAGVATTTTPDLTRVMNMAPAAAAAGLTPAADLARIITQAASANPAIATSTPTLLSMVTFVAVAAAAGTTPSVKLAQLLNRVVTVAGTTVTPPADLARLMGYPAAASAASTTSGARLARLLGMAGTLAGVTTTSMAVLSVTALVNLAAAVHAMGMTGAADLAKVIAQAVSVNTAAATGAADLFKAIALTAGAGAGAVTPAADLLKAIAFAPGVDAVTITPAADLARLIDLVMRTDAGTATPSADLARLIDLVADLAGNALANSPQLSISGGLIHLAATVIASTATPAADLSQLLQAAASALATTATASTKLVQLLNHAATMAGVTVTPAADLTRWIAQVANAGAVTVTPPADLARIISQAGSVGAGTVTSAADLLKTIALTAGTDAITVTPLADLARLVNLVAGAGAVAQIDLVELLVAGLLEIYRRRIPDAVRVGSRGVA